MTKKSLLITGASSGIGKTCALSLDQLGFKVFAGVRKTEDGDALKNEASERLQPTILDVTKPETIRQVIELISADPQCSFFGLVNNAGIGISGVLEATPEDELRKVLEVNVIGVHAVTKACLPLLRKNTGRIVNIGSSAGFLSGPGASSYSASKFAVRAITDSLRVEVKPLGMHVSLVAPGAIESDIWDKGRAYKEKMRRSANPELLKVYELFVKAGENMMKVIRPIPALEVAKVVTHALTSNRPKPVYVVGRDARKARILSRLPKGLLDWLMIKHLEQIAGRE